MTVGKAAVEEERLAENQTATERATEERAAVDEKVVAAEKVTEEKTVAEDVGQCEMEEENLTVNGVSFKMIAVQGGTFDMSEIPTGRKGYSKVVVKSVTLSSFQIGETEVTQELWQAVMGNNPSYYTIDGLKCPVERVSWNDCQSFISKLNSLTGLNFRLPTESEWEFAARGGSNPQRYHYSGSNNLGFVAWCDVNSEGHTHPVKMKYPNSLGIYDMSGNVSEWCSDWYRTYHSGSFTDPKGPSKGKYRVYRGGNFSESEARCCVWDRSWGSQSGSAYNVGLRLAL